MKEPGYFLFAPITRTTTPPPSNAHEITGGTRSRFFTSACTLIGPASMMFSRLVVVKPPEAR